MSTEEVSHWVCIWWLIFLGKSSENHMVGMRLGIWEKRRKYGRISMGRNYEFTWGVNWSKSEYKLVENRVMLSG